MSLLGNQFTGKRTIRASDGAIATSQGQSTIKAGKGTTNHLTNFEMQKT